MKLILTSIALFIAAISTTAWASDKEEVMEALGVLEPERESKITAVDLNDSPEGIELYSNFVAYFESKEEPVEFHDVTKLYPSTILYEGELLRKYFRELISERTEKKHFLRMLSKWKTQGLISLFFKVNLIEEWNDSGNNHISLVELQQDLIYAVEGERHFFLNIPDSTVAKENAELLSLLKSHRLDTVLYDEMLAYLKSSDYRSARNLAEQSENRIKEMDALNQLMYRIMWPAWGVFLERIEGANQSGDGQ
jgi:hypothetical protein